MTDVTIAKSPDLTEKRRVFLLAEDRIGHYPEFRAFFSRAFDLETVGLATPGYVRAPSGLEYALIFVGRSGEPFPAAVEIFALVDGLEPLDETVADKDLWAILRWMIAGVGGIWSVADLDATGRLYRIGSALGS
jgi:hypothetical protein